MSKDEQLWNRLKASIVSARTRKPVLNAKAIEALKARTITTTDNAELDYSAYLSEVYLKNRNNNQNK